MLTDQIQSVSPKAARKQAIAAMATMIGTLVMSRIAGSGEFSDEILGAGREAVLGREKSASNKAPKKPRMSS